MRPLPLWALLTCLNSQVVCFQISLCVGSVINITCLHHCSLISSSPLLENCGDICLIPISWDLSYHYFLSADFQSPRMNFIWAWTITVTSPILEFSCIYSTHSSRKSHLFRYRWKSNLGARFSLCHLRKSFLLREESLLLPDWLAAKTATDCHLLFSHSPCFLRKC